MAKFNLYVLVEAAQADVGPAPADRLLGRIVNVYLDNFVPGPGETLCSLKAQLLDLLCPWKWTITWTTAPAAPSFVPPAPDDPTIHQVLERVLCGIISSNQVDRLALVRNDSGSQAAPRWPALLAQLGRSSAQLSRLLGLSFVEAYDDAGPPDLDISSICFNGTTYVPGPNGNGMTLIICRQPKVWTRAELELQEVGLIERLGRRVAVTTDEDRHNWLAELPGRLGRAIDPIPRLADFAEACGLDQGTFKAAGAKALDRLLAPLGQPGAALAILLAHDGQTANPGDLNAWANAIAPNLTKLRDQMLAAVLPVGKGANDPVDAAELRSLYGGSAAPDALAKVLLEALPPGQTLVQKWLAEPTARTSILHSLLPDRLARELLLPDLTEAAAFHSQSDLVPLNNAFNQVFMNAFSTLTDGLANPHFNPVIDAQKKEVFEQFPTGADIAAANGLVIRLDTVFHSPEANAPDMHELMDGALIAVQPFWKVNGQEHEEPWKLVTFGKAELRTKAGPLQIGNVAVPLPVSFEGSWQGATPGQSEVRHAIATYHGSALIPQDLSRPPPLKGDTLALSPDTPEVDIGYSPINGHDATMAYGRDYKIAVGYVGPGGVLPRGFCRPSRDGNLPDPFSFDPQPEMSDQQWHIERQLRRTLLPGPPRLLPPGGVSKHLPIAGPGDTDVRPLWKEHAAAWTGPAAAASRERLEGAQTVFLDFLSAGAPAARSSFAFCVRPPALALGESQEGAKNAVVWRYWRARDADFDPTVKQNPPYPEADDPAVVGAPGTSQTGLGGVMVTLSSINRDRLTVVWRQHVPLGAGEKLEVEVIAEENTTLKLIQTTLHDLVVHAPPAERFLLEAQTVCDPAFFDGGSDVRFSDATPRVTVDDLVAFGRSSIVFETLPKLDHLPSREDLWKALDLGEDSATGVVEAKLSRSSEAFDYVGAVRSIRQSWDWDGGPVPPLSELGTVEAPLHFGDREGLAASRDARFQRLESLLFGTRGDAGVEERVPAVANVMPKLFRIDPPANRGADYLRCRFIVDSRYKALRTSGAEREARIGDKASDRWRGCLLSLRRRDPLPTPRLALATPLFGRLLRGDNASTAGAIALYLDQPMFERTTGAGLAEELEAEVIFENGTSGGQFSAGLDPILSGDGDPMWDEKPMPSSAQRLKCSAVLGQTLEPLSSAPRIPYAMAIFEPRTIVGRELKPDVMARIRVRTTYAGANDADPVNSPWSAPMWIHFLPDIGANKSVDLGAGKLKDVPLLCCKRYDQRLVLTANPDAGQMGAHRLQRLRDRVDDVAPGDPVHLVDSLWAVVISTVRDVAGDEVIRAREVVHATITNNEVTFPVSDGMRPRYIRLLELQRRRAEGGVESEIRDSRQPNDASLRLFGPRGGVGVDVPERIVAIGPLVAVE